MGTLSMQSRDLEKLALFLVRTLTAAPRHTMTMVAAKQAICGDKRPITDFHCALVFAENRGWIAYSDRDCLAISVCPLGADVAQLSRAA